MKVLLLGLGRANLAVARYLIERNNQVYLFEEHPENLGEAARAMIEGHRITMYEDIDYDLVIASPGFPPNKEIINWAASKAIPIVDEIEFTYTQLDMPKIIAVTGTNGKSTTAALISEILREAGFDNFLGGNIAPGTPFSQSLFLEPFAYYVLEVSSFQLMRIKKFRPLIAILTNITRDHLNWHKDFDEYRHAKARIFMNQKQNDFAVVNFADKEVRGLAKGIKAKVVFFGAEPGKGVWLNKDFYFYEQRLFTRQDLPLAGEHNMLNIAAAIAATKLLNIKDILIEKGIRGFKTLPHRLEEIGTMRGIRYVNNSMCTNESAAIASFAALDGPRIVIVGGKDKGDPATGYLDLLVQEAKACVILGDNAGNIARYFDAHNFKNFKIARNMDEAVEMARGFASAGDIILLNPGFASFDYFRDFEDRGKAFRDAAYRN